MDIPERPPALEFITLTDKPGTQKSNFSYLVRSHAMQSVVHERRNPTSKKAASASQRAAEAETKTSKELSGKFKLNTWKKKRRKKNDPTQETAEEVIGIVREEEQEGRFAEVCTFRPISRLDAKFHTQTNINASLQPYGELPISTSSSHTQQLLYHCIHLPAFLQLSSHDMLADNTGFITNAFAINYDDAWKPFSTTDSALLHATLCLVAQHEDLVRGVADSSENLFHKGEVMRLMNGRLLDESYKVTDADITSVALLVILEVIQTSLKLKLSLTKYRQAINGSFEAATAHKIGLSKMVMFYGGILALEQNQVVVRVLSWQERTIQLQV